MRNSGEYLLEANTNYYWRVYFRQDHARNRFEIFAVIPRTIPGGNYREAITGTPYLFPITGPITGTP